MAVLTRRLFPFVVLCCKVLALVWTWMQVKKSPIADNVIVVTLYCIDSAICNRAFLSIWLLMLI